MLDNIAALLTNEYVMKRSVADKYKGVLSAINAKFEALATQPQQHQHKSTVPGNVINANGNVITTSPLLGGTILIGYNTNTWTFSTSNVVYGISNTAVIAYRSFRGEVSGDVRFTE